MTSAPRPTPAELLSAAKLLASKGVKVIRLAYPKEDGSCSCGRPEHRVTADTVKSGCGKHPQLGKGWQDQATTDPEEIERWWADGRPWNVGIKCGVEERILSVDIDTPEGEQEVTRIFNGTLPRTWTFTTGGGGWRLMFRVPEGVNPKTESIPGPDGKEAVRFQCGKGAQTVAPPSLHWSGRRYEYADGLCPATCELLFMPPELIAVTCPPEPEAPPPSPRPAPRPPEGSGERSVEHRAIAYLAKCPPAVSGQGGHDDCFWVVRAIVYGFDLGPELGYEVLAEYYSPRCLPPWSEKELRHKVDDAHTKPFGRPRGWLRDEQKPGQQPVRWHRQLNTPGVKKERQEADTRAEIVLGTDEHRVNDQVNAELAGDPDLYTRGGQIVQVLEADDGPIDPASVVRRPPGTPTVRAVSKPVLRDHISRRCRFVRQRMTNEGDEIRTPAHPPGWCVDATHARGGRGFRTLVGLAPHPVLLASGEILAANGYDRGSGLLACMPPGLTVSVPDAPTRQQVAAAVAVLFDVLHDFPFETPDHRSAVVAGMLTPIAYYAFEGPAPLFLIDGNIRGVGKGLLADVLAIILTGRRFSVMSYSHDQDELRKRITTLAIEAERLVLLDNLTGAFGNGVLDAALTSDRWKDRILGGNAGYDGPIHVTWFATGNNVQLVGDTARRICPARLESPDERPETKDGFRYPNLREQVRASRGKLLSAALTILRGWITAGRPRHGLKAWGSFEGWSAVVREAVVFAGLPDPAGTREALQTSSDREALCMEVIVSHLNSFDRGDSRRGVTAADVVKRLRESAGFQSDADAEMQSAIEELCGRLDSRLLGYKFRSFKRRNFNGLMLDLAGEDRMKGNRWRAVPVGANFHRGPIVTTPADAGDAGDAGDVPGQLKAPADDPAATHAGDAGDAGDVSPRRKTADRPTGGRRFKNNQHRGTTLDKDGAA